MSTNKKRRNGCSSLADFPVRDCSKLLVHPLTLECVLKGVGCVACAYKIGCFDVARDVELCRRVPNVRPELCPRISCATTTIQYHSRSSTEKSSSEASTTTTTTTDPPCRVLGYVPGIRVLTLGDGDFTFSLAVARMVSDNGVVWATSYESEATLQSVYKNDFNDTLRELKDRNVKVQYQVDATQLNQTFSLSESNNHDRRFDRIVWNFPCSAIARGQDGQNQEMDCNKDLVRKFVAQARHYLTPNGQIHINHKTKPPYNQWNLAEVALEDCHQYEGPHVHYLGRVVLDRALLPPYVPRKALCQKSFPVHDACTYMFGLDGSLWDFEHSNLVDDVMLPVTVEMIERIRDSLLQRSVVSPQRKKKKPRTKR